MRTPNQRLTRVLIADDEPIIADTLRTILRLNGFESKAAYTGQQALEAARQWHPDIFLTDVIMPDASGIEVAIEVCVMNPFCRVLLLSGIASTIDFLAGGREAGHGFEVIAKPIHPTDLVRRLRSPRSRSIA